MGMNPLLEIRNGKRYFGRHVIDGYQFGVWLADYNYQNNTNIRPSTATAETFKLHLAALKRGWWKNYGKVAA